MRGAIAMSADATGDEDFRILPGLPATLAQIIGSWKPAKRAAARYIAIGCTHEYTAERVDVTDRTIRLWCAEQDFDRYVRDLRREVIARIEPQIMVNLEHALEVQRMVFAGGLGADDKRALAAERFIYRFLDRLLYVEPAAPAGGNAAPGVNVPITLNVGNPPGAPAE